MDGNELVHRRDERQRRAARREWRMNRVGEIIQICATIGVLVLGIFTFGACAIGIRSSFYLPFLSRGWAAVIAAGFFVILIAFLLKLPQFFATHMEATESTEDRHRE